MMSFKEKPKKPTDPKMDSFLSMRYAEELRQRHQQGAFGAFNQGSHMLQPSELLLSDMVMKGLNNLAYVTLRMQQEVRMPVVVEHHDDYLGL